MLNPQTIKEIAQDTSIFIDLSKDNTKIEAVQCRIPYYGDTKPYKNELDSLKEKGLLDVNLFSLSNSYSLHTIEKNSEQWISAALDNFAFKRIELRGYSIHKQLLKILALQASSLREFQVNFETLNLAETSIFLCCDLPHLEKFTFQIGSLPLENLEEHALVFSQFLNRHLSNLKSISLQFDQRSLYQVLFNLEISPNSLTDQEHLPKLEEATIIGYPTLKSSSFDSNPANVQVISINESQKAIAALLLNLRSFGLHFAGSLVCEKQMNEIIQCLANKLVEFRFSVTHTHTRFSLDCLFDYLRRSDCLRVLCLDLSFAMNASMGKVQMENTLIHLKQLQEFTLILALNPSAEQVMKIFKFNPQTLSKLSFEIAFIADISIASSCLMELSDWVDQNNESLDFLHCKVNQSLTSNESNRNLSEAIEKCPNLTSLSLIGLTYENMQGAVWKALSCASQRNFCFYEEFLFVKKQEHMLLFPLMDRNNKKISSGVFRDILIGSKKSIRQIAVPDTIFKSIEDGNMIPSLEFLNFQERIKLLHECNPLLQTINLLSYTQPTEQQFDNNFLDLLEQFRNLRSFVFNFASGTFIIKPDFRLKILNWVKRNYFLETFNLGYAFSYLSEALLWRKENQNRLRFSIKLFNQTEIPKLFRQDVVNEMLSFLV